MRKIRVTIGFDVVTDEDEGQFYRDGWDTHALFGDEFVYPTTVHIEELNEA